MNIENELFSRTALLVGDETMARVSACSVIIFGIGGVGSWVAESLVRSGIRKLTLVDSDCIDATNVNRQCPATANTIGSVKVDAMKSRLLDINPKVEVEAIQGVYSRETQADYHIETYDYIIDAIDSLECKMDLILHATSLPYHVKFFSSMGAALKMDPTQIRVDEFWKVKGCPLARALRQKFKRTKQFPKRKFKVVYSPEVLENKGKNEEETMTAMKESQGINKPIIDGKATDWHQQKVHVNGTVAHTTAIFGFMLAGLVMQDICSAERE